MLRRIYDAPGLLQLIATFALVLVIRTLRWRFGVPKICSARGRRAFAARSISRASRF